MWVVVQGIEMSKWSSTDKQGPAVEDLYRLVHWGELLVAWTAWWLEQSREMENYHALNVKSR